MCLWFKKTSTLLLLALLTCVEVRGQAEDTLNTYLLLNPFIQIEATEAINSMYNFEFNKSKSHFLFLKYTYPDHPLPYLLLGLNYWWRIVPNYKNERWDDLFIANMDTVKSLARQLRTKNQVEGAFFLAAAYAFEGRLYSERGKYRKAAFAGKNSLKYLGECRGHQAYSPELLFGDALFNYYAEWIREEYPLLRPLMLLFPKGDKEMGISQLKEVAQNSFYSRVEAQYYLMRLLALEENDLPGAIRVAEYLTKQFPNNAYFERFYTRLLYQSGQYNKVIKLSNDILRKVDSSRVGYEANSARYATFYLGHIYEIRKQYSMAKDYYKKSLIYARQVDATDKGYYFYSLLHLGKIAQKEGDEALAKGYYKQVKKVANRGHSAYKSARKRLKDLS